MAIFAVFKMEETHHTLSVFADNASSANDVAKTSPDRVHNTIVCLACRDEFESIVANDANTAMADTREAKESETEAERKC